MSQEKYKKYLNELPKKLKDFLLNKVRISLMKDFNIEGIENGNKFKHRGSKCYFYFFDMLTALQCPEDAYILSDDKDFDELGKVIGRPDLLLNFDEWPLENN